MMTSRFSIALFGVLFLMLGLLDVGLAEMPSAEVVMKMKDGKVTAVGKDEVQIDGSSYRINENAQIVDHEGQTLSVEDIDQDIHKRAVVKYLLKAGKIEVMIVTNPQ
ncbi:MAG: hypothetical protein E8D49_05315 [Nitrospira sp.]|nr:MAG: hypothetical protein E8D49_05315 [Nitrospira sp.]